MNDDCVRTLVSIIKSFIPYMDPIANLQRGFILRNSDE